MVWQASVKHGVSRPWEVAGDVEVPRNGVTTRGIRVQAGHEDGVTVPVDLRHDDVLLAALPAKAERQESLLCVAGDSELIGVGEVANVFGFKRDINRVALGEKLMEAEGEERASRFGVDR
jgi:hypothetical protein